MQKYRVVAVDLRGYNLSDKPKGVESYAMPLLVGDIAAVVSAERFRARGHRRARLGRLRRMECRHAASRTSRELLIICNLPHPAGIAREIATNPQQKKNSEYAFNFQKPDAHKALQAERLTQWVTDPAAQAALRRRVQQVGLREHAELLQGELSEARCTAAARGPSFPKVKVPVLMFHGLEDQALLPGALNGTWQWVEKDLTIVTIPAPVISCSRMPPDGQRHDGRLAVPPQVGRK